MNLNENANSTEVKIKLTNSNISLTGNADFLVVDRKPTPEEIESLEVGTVILEYDPNDTDRVFGASAYEIAAQHGFSGSQSEWIANLKGEQGATGAKGDKGDKGEQGTDGKDGANGLSAAHVAIQGGWQGTEEEYNQELINLGNLREILELIAVEKA